MYAIIETGGKQYRVTPGDVVAVEKLDGNVGTALTFDKVLLVGGKSDNQVLVGTPFVAKASLQAEIVEQTKGEKLLTIKYKRRKGYRRTIGHRQLLTKILVTALDDGRGQSMKFEGTKRNAALIAASVPFSTRQADHEAKHGGAAKPAQKATKKAAAHSEATEKKPAKKAAPAKATKAKKE